MQKEHLNKILKKRMPHGEQWDAKKDHLKLTPKQGWLPHLAFDPVQMQPRVPTNLKNPLWLKIKKISLDQFE